MYNFQIVSGGIKEREIKQGLKLRPSFDQAIEEDVEDPMLEQYRATGVFKSQKYQNILNNSCLLPGIIIIKSINIKSIKIW